MRITIILVILCILGFVLPFFADYGAIIDQWGFSGANVVLNPLVLFSSIFLHGGLDHLLSNILVLLFFGLAVENEIGKAKTLGLFFIGAFFGDFLSLFIYSWSQVSIGASAGIFALIGIGMLVKPLDLSFYPFIIPVPLLLLGMMYIAYNIYGFFSGTDTNISYIGHFGGLIAGLIYGIKRKGLGRSIMLIALASLLLILIPVIWGIIASIIF